MDISRLSGIFLEAVKGLNEHPQPHRRFPKREDLVNFDLNVSWPWQYVYDELTYEAKIEIAPSYNTKTKTQYFPLNIRLSNDGFLPHYHTMKAVDWGSPEASAKKFQEEHHKRKYWIDLDEASGNYFGPIVSFAKQWMGIGVTDEPTRIQYNTFFQRVDMHFQSQKQDGCVFLRQVTFEPGAPIKLFDDPWQNL